MYKLCIVWRTGDREVYYYSDLKVAKKAERGYKKAFGDQILWTGIWKGV